MAKKLTVKEGRVHRVTADGLKALLRLYEIAYGLNLKKEYAKIHPRRTKALLIDEGKKCSLCDETETLDIAHIIPLAITNKIPVDGEPIEYLRHAISLCPTHHRKYDKYQLNTQDKYYVRKFIKLNRYDKGLAYLLESIEILNPTSDIDRRIDIAWRWWREYCYGN